MYFKDLLVLQNQVCVHGNQHVVILMLCKNTEDTALVYGLIHLDDTVALTKYIDNIIGVHFIVTPPTFLYKGH